MFDPKTFTGNLYTARKRQGLSQKELAQKLFVSTQAISKWERGESSPDIAHICALAQLLGMSVEKLLGVEASAEKALIAVDGGGTKTEFVLIAADGRLLRRLVLPGSNPNSCTPEGTLRILCQGIDSLLREGFQVLAVFVGGAGMASGGHGEATEAALRKAYPHLAVQCRSDIMNILALAKDPDNAIAVICGTGSVVYATHQGKLLRFGGGGWRLETAGSGYDMGREALLAALEHRDGTGPSTMLTELVEQRLGGGVWANVSKLHLESTAYVAGFAPLVTHAWQKGDATAVRIVSENLHRLSHLIAAAAEKAPRAKQVLLGGSLLAENAAFRQALQQQLPPGLDSGAIAYPPIWGACLQCIRLAGLPCPDPQAFMHSYTQEV